MPSMFMPFQYWKKNINLYVIFRTLYLECSVVQNTRYSKYSNNQFHVHTFIRFCEIYFLYLFIYLRNIYLQLSHTSH